MIATGPSRRTIIAAAAMFGALAALRLDRMAATAAETTPLAIRGYDPIAYFALGRPMRGRPDISYDWDEHRYLFASAEHRAQFAADPGRYAPQFSNYCAMALTRGEVTEADPENWLVSGGKLYIFGKVEGPALFQDDLSGNIGKANQNRILLPR